MKIKVLLLGSAGMAGQILKIELLKLSDKIDLIDIARSTKISIPTINLDITNFEALYDIIIRYKFDFILNCVGLLNSGAEKNPDQAILINSYLPHYLEKITSELKTKIIHISTDCVFSGKAGSYIESDIKDGIGFYAQSKALGEIINDKDLTIRTSIIGPDLNKYGVGLFNWVLKQTGQIKGFNNALWSGVTTIHLAKIIIEILLSSKSPTGLIHLTNNNKISKYALLSIIKNVFDLNNIEVIGCNNYIVDKSLINTRDDFRFNVPTYDDMILEMKEWIIQNKYQFT
jgi:dTDP-4-dehydrorhamnose reductase